MQEHMAFKVRPPEDLLQSNEPVVSKCVVDNSAKAEQIILKIPLIGCAYHKVLIGAAGSVMPSLTRQLGGNQPMFAVSSGK